MNRESEQTATLRTEIWGARDEGGSPTLPSDDECRRCGDPSLGEFSLCRACFGTLPEGLCTAHVLDALDP